MKPAVNENNKPIPGLVKYVRIILGIVVILIGSLSFFQFLFNNPAQPNEQGSFLYSFFCTLFIASGIWLIATRNKPSRRDLTKSRLYRSLLIMIGVILTLVAITFFFD